MSSKVDKTKVISESSEVLMHFQIRLKDGSIAESTRAKDLNKKNLNIKSEINTETNTEIKDKPVAFTMGQGVFSDKFEQELIGLTAGDKKKIMLLPEDGFGKVHPANIYQVPKDKFESFEQPLEVGLIIEFAQINGSAQVGVVKDITEDEVSIDFNHPLSGQVVLFDVEIMAVR